MTKPNEEYNEFTVVDLLKRILDSVTRLRESADGDELDCIEASTKALRDVVLILETRSQVLQGMNHPEAAMLKGLDVTYPGSIKLGDLGVEYGRDLLRAKITLGEVVALDQLPSLPQQQ